MSVRQPQRRVEGVRQGRRHRAPGHRPRDRRAGVHLADRPVGLREVDAAADRRRPDPADRGRGRRQRQVGRPGAHDRDYGIVFQDAVLYDWRTVAKNIALPLEMLGWDRRRRAERVQRVAAARRAGRLREPPPVAALGRDAAARLDRAGAVVLPAAPADGRAVRRARRDDTRAAEHRAASHLGGAGSTIVFVTHSISEAVFLSTRVVVMSPAARADHRHRRHRPPAAAHGRDRASSRASSSSSPTSGTGCAGLGRGAASEERADRRRGGAVSVGPTAVQPVPRGVFAKRSARAARLDPRRRRLRPRHGAWEFGVKALDVQNFLLPPLSDILEALWDDRSGLMSAAWFTFKEALGGFVIGSAPAILLALVLARWRPSRARHALRDRRQRHPDHRLRPDHEQLVRAALAGVEDRDRGDHLLLPGVREHPARADLGPPGLDRADAQLRGGRARDLPARADPERAAVHLLGLEGRDRTRDDRRHRGRLLRRLAGLARDRDPARRGHLRVRARVGGDRRGERARNPVLRCGRARRAVRDAVASLDTDR